MYIYIFINIYMCVHIYQTISVFCWQQRLGGHWLVMDEMDDGQTRPSQIRLAGPSIINHLPSTLHIRSRAGDGLLALSGL